MAVEISSWNDHATPRSKSSNICYVNVIPDELWLKIFKFIHPVYYDLFHLSFVCKKWYNLVHSDPYLWEQIPLSNLRRCSSESPLLKRFRKILIKYGKFIKTLAIHRCHQSYLNCLLQFIHGLVSLQTLELTGTKYNKELLRNLLCYKSLRNIVVEASDSESGDCFTVEDVHFLSDNFPSLNNIGLHFSSLKSQELANLMSLSSSKGRDKVTYLVLERGRLEERVLNDVFRGFQQLKNFCFSNDHNFSWPSANSHKLKSQSITSFSIFSIGDVAELILHFPSLRKLQLANSTSMQNLEVHSSSLRSLVLTNCAELRKLRKVHAFSLQELQIKGCPALCQAELLYFFAKNPDIKTMVLGVYWSHLRLDQHSNPSLESLFISDNGEFLSTLDLRCSKLKRLCFKKAFLRPAKLKAVRILGDEYVLISFSDVPYLQKISADTRKIDTFEVDFDRSTNQIIPAAFTKIKFVSDKTQIRCLVLRRCNISSVTLTSCNVKHITFDSCNLDCMLSDILDKCGTVESITFNKCYGPCQLLLKNPFIRMVSVSNCSILMMERITLVCSSLEQLDMNHFTFLLTACEVEHIGNSLKEYCPKLKSLNFLCQTSSYSYNITGNDNIKMV